jgi:hypothetical protein
MEDLRKISGLQLYNLWKNLSIGLFMIVFTMSMSKLLPSIFAPIAAVICSIVLYTMIYKNPRTDSDICSLTLYCFFVSLIVYAFVTIAMNIFVAWHWVSLPDEFVIFTNPFIPSLLMMPICFVVIGFIYFRRHSLSLCADCKLQYGTSLEKGKSGYMLNRESYFQLKNLIGLSLSLSILIWTYYLLFYVKINQNSRDWYVFTWLVIIFIILDEIYFIYRYYNIYIELKLNNEIISPNELQNACAKTYLRYYVICDNYIYVNRNVPDLDNRSRDVIDTPFFTKRSTRGLPTTDVQTIIEKMTGVKNGELKFFYGRKSIDFYNHSILRYFYFLDGKPSDYPNLNETGEWINYEDIKKMYCECPTKLARISVVDTNRLATIIITEKTYDEEGYRKSKIRNYAPTFNLHDVRNSNLDFQDDKWIKISMYNSDLRSFRFRKWLQKNKSNIIKGVNSWKSM